ncbi:MAG: transcription elongation factor [Gillisia sp.]
MKDLESDLGNETKSSAGDKYETGREMINAEWNKLSVQFSEFKKLEAILKMAKSRKCSKNIQLGSLVTTTVANYFICIPAGQLQLKNEKFYAVGVTSPIGQLLLNKMEGDNFIFKGKQVKILGVK